jgi:hypothetical protein
MMTEAGFGLFILLKLCFPFPEKINNKCYCMMSRLHSVSTTSFGEEGLQDVDLESVIKCEWVDDETSGMGPRTLPYQ